MGLRFGPGIPLISLSQTQNATSGDLFALEAAVQKRFTFLPQRLEGFRISANGTYVDSSAEVPGRAQRGARSARRRSARTLSPSVRVPLAAALASGAAKT